MAMSIEEFKALAAEGAANKPATVTRTYPYCECGRPLVSTAEWHRGSCRYCHMDAEDRRNPNGDAECCHCRAVLHDVKPIEGHNHECRECEGHP